MSVLTLVHAVLAGTLFAGAAWCAEAGLRRLGLPGRWPWIVAIIGTLAAPFAGPSPSELLAGLSAPDSGWSLDAILAAGPIEAVDPSGAKPEVTSLNLARPWIPLAWSILALAGVVSLAGGFRRLERQARRWPPARVVDEPVLVSPDFGPAVLGLRRSRTVLPRWALSLPERELKLILRHESAHRSAKDPQVLAFGVLMAALAPWNPAMWIAVRRLREAVEKDCDRRVLRAGADRLSYARMLVSMRGRGGRPLGSTPVPALTENPHSLERRIKTMWMNPSRRPAVPALLGAAVLLVVACESPTPTVTQPEPAQSLSAETAGASGALVEARGTDDAPDPLIVLDGVVYEGAVSLLAPADIERIDVLKGEAAREAYGDAGADGVVEITTKDAAGTAGSSPGASDTEVAGTVRVQARPSTGTFRVDGLPGGEQGILDELSVKATDGALVFVDGVEVEEGLPATLRPEDIERVEVIKGEAAARLVGERAARGVIQITTKKGAGTGG
jgi:hypothetical protein